MSYRYGLQTMAESSATETNRMGNDLNADLALLAFTPQAEALETTNRHDYAVLLTGYVGHCGAMVHVCLSVSVSLSVSLCVSVYVSVSLCLSLSVSFSVSICLSVSDSFSLSFSVSLYIPSLWPKAVTTGPKHTKHEQNANYFDMTTRGMWIFYCRTHSEPKTLGIRWSEVSCVCVCVCGGGGLRACVRACALVRACACVRACVRALICVAHLPHGR